jgi:pimeloyl-ACP methyl ester carboxylesterase/DNA-binding CsgD family transcriptional regulator
MSQPVEQVRFCTSRDGTRIAYSTAGAGPPLVWVANWTRHLKLDWDSPVWRPWLSMLARRHTLVRYDMRGCGLSDREGVEFSVEEFVADLEAVIEATGLDRFVLVGMAGGAAIGMTYAARYPKRVSHLVLYAGYVRNRLAGNPTPEEVEEAHTRLKVMELGWPNDTPAYGQFYTSLYMPDATAEQSRSFADLVRKTTSLANAVAVRRTFFRIDMQGIVPKVRCPTLVLHCRGDSIIPFEQGRSVAGLIPGARFVPFDSRNHVLLDTEPAWPQLVEALDDFLPDPRAQSAESLGTPHDALTTREREVLELVAQGLDNDAIGRQLHISKRTARNHVSLILSKLGAISRAQVIIRARDAGFGRKAVAAPSPTPSKRRP